MSPTPAELPEPPGTPADPPAPPTPGDVPQLLKRRRRLKAAADAHAADVASHPAAFDTATVDALWQRAYAQAKAEQPDIQELKIVLGFLFKVWEHEREGRKLAALERKAALADQARETVAGPLPPEERERRLREIFALPPLRPDA